MRSITKRQSCGAASRPASVRICVAAVLSALLSAPAALAQAPGTIVTIAGGGAVLGDGGPATDARLLKPAGVAVDAAGNLFISDTDHSRVRRVVPGGTITTVLGNGYADYTGDGGPGAQAAMNSPFNLSTDRTGGLLVSDYFDEVIRRLGPDGRVTTVAGIGPPGVALGGFSGDGGPAAAARLSSPDAVVIDDLGEVFISDDASPRVRHVGVDGVITTFDGGGAAPAADGVPATQVRLGSVNQLALDGAGNLYVADGAGNRILRVTPDGITFVVAGTGMAGFAGDGGPAVQAQLFAPLGLALDSAGSVFIADSGNQRVRQVKPDGTITTIAGAADLSTGHGLARNGFAGDGGPAAQALFGYPEALAIDASGNLYIADTSNDRVREVFGIAAPAVFPKPPSGDLNGDGRVTVVDATLALKIAVGLVAPSIGQLSAGELGGGFSITVADALAILRRAIAQ